MATQESVIKLKGSLGDLAFYKTADGFLARKKGGISAQRMRNDPAFVRTRENGAEFARAGKAAKLLRLALRTHLLSLADKRMTSRLMQVLMQVVQSDATNPRGQRNVIDGEAALLDGFEFNENARLRQTMLAPFTATIERSTGAMTINIESFVPNEMIVFPSGATHCSLVIVGALVDFEGNSFVMDHNESNPIALTNQAQAEQVLSATLPANSTQPLFLALGIRFFQEVNSQFYPLRNGAHNGLAFVSVDGSV